LFGAATDVPMLLCGGVYGDVMVSGKIVSINHVMYVHGVCDDAS
jgi:hypothetical protein